MLFGNNVHKGPGTRGKVGMAHHVGISIFIQLFLFEPANQTDVLYLGKTADLLYHFKIIGRKLYLGRVLIVVKHNGIAYPTAVEQEGESYNAGKDQNLFHNLYFDPKLGQFAGFNFDGGQTDE